MLFGINMSTRIGKDLANDIGLYEPRFEQEPFERFRQAHRHSVPMDMLKRKHPVRIRTKGGAIGDDKDTIAFVPIEPFKHL